MEEAVSEYGHIINTFAARDNLINLYGVPTGSSNTNLSNVHITAASNGIFDTALDYGTVIGTGGNKTWYSGSINIFEGEQTYNLKNSDVEFGSFTTDKFTIRKLFHYRTPASTRFLDSSYGTPFASEQFGFTGYVVPGQYLMMPLNYDAYRMQAIEFNDEMRKSAYSFQITGNRLRIFPVPTIDTKLHFLYTLDLDALPINSDGSINSDAEGKITDMSNIPYGLLKYSNINSIGKQWIRKFTLAICKEILGYIRSKYATLPIADSEVTLNGADLVSAGTAEKETLSTQLRELLDQASRQSQLERKVAESSNLNQQLKFYPLKIYVR